MKAINNPIPPVTANFIFLGIAFTTASLTLNNDNIIKIIPSINTADNAISHETPICPTTVYAKYAFNPIPEAKANGKLANTPIRIHAIPAAKHVEVTNAPAGIPVVDKIFGLTAIIYAIVKNVVNPPIISFFISTFLFDKIGRSFSFIVKFSIIISPYTLYL